MAEIWWRILGLAALTFVIWISGFLLGARLPRGGFYAQAFNALPGCLITALVTVLLMQGGVREWLAAGVALAIAVITSSLPLTMLAGIGAVWLSRTF
jgi:uncharacterized membrane protein